MEKHVIVLITSTTKVLPQVSRLARCLKPGWSLYQGTGSVVVVGAVVVVVVVVVVVAGSDVSRMMDPRASVGQQMRGTVRPWSSTSTPQR